MSIPFTQYLMPDGRKAAVTIDRPAAVEAKAELVIKSGCRFEIEMLQTGVISMEIVRDVPDPDIDDSIAIELCHNGPTEGDRLGVPEAVDKLVATACEVLKL